MYSLLNLEFFKLLALEIFSSRSFVMRALPRKFKIFSGIIQIMRSPFRFGILYALETGLLVFSYVLLFLSWLIKPKKYL